MPWKGVEYKGNHKNKRAKILKKRHLLMLKTEK